MAGQEGENTKMRGVDAERELANEIFPHIILIIAASKELRRSMKNENYGTETSTLKKHF